MSLIKYVHVYAAGPDQVHMQATGDAFPTGYASCNIDTSPAVVAECGGPAGKHSPSMRPNSWSRYLPCTIDGGDTIVTPEGEVVCSIVAAVAALRGPSPAYSQNQANVVREQIERTIEQGSRPLPTEEPAAVWNDDEEDEDAELANELATAILAVLKKYRK